MKSGTKRRFADLNESYEHRTIEIVGLSMNNLHGEVMGPHFQLPSKLISTLIGISGGEKSRSIFHQLPLASELNHPITMVSANDRISLSSVQAIHIIS